MGQQNDLLHTSLRGNGRGETGAEGGLQGQQTFVRRYCLVDVRIGVRLRVRCRGVGVVGFEIDYRGWVTRCG